MSVSVFSAAPQLHATPGLVCQLYDTTVDEALGRLGKAGILAAPSPDESSIILLGFNYEVSALVSDLQRYGYARKPQSRFTLGKLRRLSIAS